MLEYYCIANVHIEINSDLSYPIDLGVYSEYQYSGENIDYVIQIQECNNFDGYYNKLSRLLMKTPFSHIYQDESGQEWNAYICDNYYLALSHIGKSKGELYHYGSTAFLQLLQGGYGSFSFLGLEKILMEFQCLLLHSSHIKYQGKSILFTAPSQTGKSTQANLWNQCLDAKVVNGDRTALRKQNDMWMAYGIPFCGSSSICHNDYGIIGAIIVLKQGLENQVERLSQGEAFRYLYSEMTIQYWNMEYVNKVVDLIQNLISQVPVFIYHCTKDIDAVHVLNHRLIEEDIINA